MGQKTIATAMREEQSIFRRFNSFKKLSRSCTAFASPDSKQVPHWNLVYPPSLKHRYSPDEVRAARSFYSRVGVPGHVLVAGDEWISSSAESVEYFVCGPARHRSSNQKQVEEFSSPDGADLGDFCDIVRACFGFSAGTARYFRRKMEILARAVPSRFWIIEYEGRRCGTASVFRTDDDSGFLFNFGVLPQFRNKDLGAAMLRHLVQRSGKTVYTYSHNPIMREHLLPEAGFRSLGITHAVPIQRYLAARTPHIRLELTAPGGTRRAKAAKRPRRHAFCAAIT